MYKTDFCEVFIKFKYVGLIYKQDCHADNLMLCYKSVYDAPTSFIPLLLR